MAARSGSTGRSTHAELSRKPPLPSFGASTKPRAKSDASKSDPTKSKENATEVKNDKSDKTSDSNSDPGNPTRTNKSETEPKLNSHSKDGTHATTKPKGDSDKTEPPKTDSKKAAVKTMVIPSRYMSGAATTKPPPRTTPPINNKPTPKPPTTTSNGLRAKTPEKSTTERHAKTPTKQPTTPRATTTSTASTMNRTHSATTTAPKRITPTPTTPTRDIKRKTPVPPKGNTMKDINNNNNNNAKHSSETPPLSKEDVMQQFNIKIAGLQAQIKQLTLERDSFLFQQNQSEGSEMSDWDESLASSVDGASENSSEQGDYERDEKYIEMVKRYRSTLSVLSQKIVILKTALTDAKSEYDTLQTQHKSLLAAHQQSLSDLDKVNGHKHAVAEIS